MGRRLVALGLVPLLLVACATAVPGVGDGDAGQTGERGKGPGALGADPCPPVVKDTRTDARLQSDEKGPNQGAWLKSLAQADGALLRLLEAGLKRPPIAQPASPASAVPEASPAASRALLLSCLRSDHLFRHTHAATAGPEAMALAQAWESADAQATGPWVFPAGADHEAREAQADWQASGGAWLVTWQRWDRGPSLGRWQCTWYPQAQLRLVVGDLGGQPFRYWVGNTGEGEGTLDRKDGEQALAFRLKHARPKGLPLLP